MEILDEVEESLSPFNFDLVVEHATIEIERVDVKILSKLSPASVPIESETIESEAQVQVQYIETEELVPDMKTSF